MVDFAKLGKILEDKRALAKANEEMHLDFETRSVCDLKKFGLDIYSRHPSTDVWCASFCIDDGPIETWYNPAICPMTEDEKITNAALLEIIIAHVKARKKVKAHNAPFEFAIWNNCMRRKYGWPVLQISQMDCTMARAHAMSLPPALANLAPALGISSHKDMTGRALMMKMAQPRKINDDGTYTWWDEPDKIARLGLYCMQDVNVERECDKKLVPLSAYEKLVWLMDQRINFRGIGVDRAAIIATRPMLENVKRKLDWKIREFTNGVVQNATQASKILQWANDQGVDIESLRKNEMNDWLGLPDLPANVRAVLEIRGDGAKSSVAKLETAMSMSIWDGRLRGMFQYHGANTGRWAARGVQLHNMPRPPKELKDPQLQDEIITGITSGALNEDFIEDWHGPFMRVISACVRGYLVSADGFIFRGADLSNIESVALAWLAAAEWKLEAFRKNFFHHGPGVYELVAGKILGKDYNEVTDDERQVYGKVSELALGFGGGKGAYLSMAVNYGVHIDEYEAEDIKLDWRQANPEVVQYWAATNKAAMDAVRTPGQIYYNDSYYNFELETEVKLNIPKDRLCAFRVAGSFLWLRLPSGRVLCYPYPQIEDVLKPWGKVQASITFMGIDGRQKSATYGKWTRLSTYGGSLVENITQAIARDVLVHGMMELDKRQYPLVLHVHDEAVTECRLDFGSVKEVEECMQIVPAWAKDMPLKAKGFEGRRYRK